MLQEETTGLSFEKESEEMNMYVQVKSSNGIQLVPMETRLLADRKIFIEGEINEKMASDFARQLMILIKEDAISPIDVIINSCGGDCNSGLMLYDILQTVKTPVRMFCMGKAYSMAAVLFASGRNGRYMMPNSELMLHEPLLGNKVGGNSSSIRSISESLLEVKQKINEILAKHTGKTVNEIERATSYDHYYSPQESIDFGLCDEIVGFDEIMEG